MHINRRASPHKPMRSMVDKINLKARLQAVPMMECMHCTPQGCHGWLTFKSMVHLILHAQPLPNGLTVPTQPESGASRSSGHFVATAVAKTAPWR